MQKSSVLMVLSSKDGDLPSKANMSLQEVTGVSCKGSSKIISPLPEAGETKGISNV